MRLKELDANLSDPEVGADINRYRSLSREQSEAAHVVGLFRSYQAREADRATAEEMLADVTLHDAEMQAMAREEADNAETDLLRLDRELKAALLPRDPDDERNAFLEIRAGTGGDESALFAGDLARMYLRFCERRGWRTEVLSENAAELGGYKELVLRIDGDAVYGQLKFESGGHRVQRVPATETQGRIHTSACTVAILPEADPVKDITINPSDLRIDTFRASSAGGQHINKTDSAVRIVHIPTGVVVECQDGRSQHQNKARAMEVLASRLLEREREAAHAKEAGLRKSLVGSGDRSERIRTYNYPQGRMTDHRINLTLYKLDFIMDGDIGEMMDALRSEYQAEQMSAMEGATA